ncbi:MAG TPA: VCBS repeat-containing protein [Thermoanaerobaculia bacterium]|nr:VCBS repeat-containing protein [Thermoanaerobaculia bacterium]
MKRLQWALICLAVFAWRAPAQELRTVPLHRFGISSDGIGRANIVLADITGDGRAEVVSCSAAAPLAYGFANGTYVPVWHGPAAGCATVTAGDRDGDGATDIIAGTSEQNGAKLLVFDPRGLGGPRASVTLPGTQGATDIAFGNVDLDAAPEIVVITDGGAYVYDAATLELQWDATGYGGTEVELADIDGDARLEIVVNGAQASVLDGGSETLKWGYVGGFGWGMSTGNVDADAKAEIVFLEGDYYDGYEIVMLSGDTFTTASIPVTSFSAGKILVADANGDGANEIVFEGYDLRGIRPSDGVSVWTMTTPESGVFGWAVGDPDGDAIPELVWGAGTSSYRDILLVGQPSTQTIEHTGIDLDGDMRSAVGDVDGDGRIDLVVASSHSKSNYEGGIVQLVDPVTHAVKGQFSQTGVQYLDIYAVAIGQLDADPAREVVALGTQTYDPQVVVWDGVTRQVEWKSPIAAWNAPEFTTTDFAVVNLDGDPVDEILLGMSDSKLIVLNGASSIIQGSRTINGVLVDLEVANIDGDSALEVVMGTTTTLYVLDAPTLATQDETALASIKRVSATAAGGGRIAVSFNASYSTANLRLYDTELTPFWTCTTGTTFDDYYASHPSLFAPLGGETHLLVGTGTGALRMYPIAGGDTCPSFSSTVYGANRFVRLAAHDVTGDGRAELIADMYNAVEIDLAGLSTETRPDLDPLADYLLGAAPGLSPRGDINGDQRISPEDLFALVHYQFAGGPEPQP